MRNLIYNYIQNLIEQSNNFSLINEEIISGNLNEDIVINALCEKESLNIYIFDAILFMRTLNKNKLIANIKKISNNSLGLYLFISSLSKKSIPYGIGTQELENIANEIVEIGDSLAMYLYGEYIKELKINKESKYKIIRCLTLGVGKKSAFLHINMFLENVINKINFTSFDKLILKKTLIDNIISENKTETVTKFIYSFNQPVNVLYLDVNKIEVYEKLIKRALIDKELMVIISYLDFNEDELNYLGKLILETNDVFFIYCFARKFIYFKNDLQEEYVDYLTLHIEEYEKLKNTLQTILLNYKDKDIYIRQIKKC